MTYRFWLPGEPVAQARARTGKGHAYYPKKSAGYRKWAVLQLRHQLEGRPILTGPLQLTLSFYRVRPKSDKSLWPTTRPDFDNLGKQVTDAMNRKEGAGVYVDDSQVCIGHIEKLWTVDQPGVEIVVAELM